MVEKTRDEKITICLSKMAAAHLTGRAGYPSEKEMQGLSPQSLQDLISRLGGLVT